MNTVWVGNSYACKIQILKQGIIGIKKLKIWKMRIKILIWYVY